jgi:hypothetical protein
MRTIGWLVAVLLNCTLVLAFAPAIFEGDAPAEARAVGAVVVLLGLAIVGLLLLARLARLPSWGSQAMRYLCISFPVLWLLGSLDHGILSGQELVSIAFICVFAWGTWRAFKLFPPQV